MGTDCRIGILHEDGTTETIYCYLRDYPEHHLSILTEYYNTLEKVRTLLNRGCTNNLKQCLSSNINKLQNFKNSSHKISNHKNITELVKKNPKIGYFYLFSEIKNIWVPVLNFLNI